MVKRLTDLVFLVLSSILLNLIIVCCLCAILHMMWWTRGCCVHLLRDDRGTLICFICQLPLCNTAYDVVDKGLLCAFVERWQRDTNMFHLPVDEMTITLDDVSSLLYIPIVGQFSTYVRSWKRCNKCRYASVSGHTGPLELA